MAFKTLKGKIAERATPGTLQLLNEEDVERLNPKKTVSFLAGVSFFPPVIFSFFPLLQKLSS